MVTIVKYNCVLYCKKVCGRLVVSTDSKERCYPNNSAALPVATQVPMITDNSKGDIDGQVTPKPASDSTDGSGADSTSNRENNPPTGDTGGSSKRDLEESTFTRPQEDLLYID